ncbi:hypothetical protein [Anianabacter salinae]|uniref:hypothetical protein n=1 Tax=Anianabacter salinae TaxID=2851023 RepID=UPI00225DD448|nr:hypothetical protein [Anianabacter salinae]MBV0913043.1 hypothetical protein [Anianabacter salinae]
MPLYFLHGLTVSSDLTVAEWPAAVPGSAPDAHIRLGAVPLALEGARETTEMWDAAPRRLLLRIAPAGRFLISDGQDIVIDAAQGATDGDLVAFVVSSALAALLHQRALLLIHASVVLIGGRAVFLFGPSGAGKSTTAAALAARGFPVISDDQLVCRRDASGTFHALPGTSRVRLWSDAADALGHDTADAVRLRTAEAKYAVTVDHAGGISYPVAMGVRLIQRQGAALGIAPMPRVAAFEDLWTYCFRRRYAIGMGDRARVFRDVSALAAGVPVMSLTRPVERFTAGEVADLVLSAAGTQAHV